MVLLKCLYVASCFPDDQNDVNSVIDDMAIGYIMIMLITNI